MSAAADALRLRLQSAARRASEALLAERDARGVWVGELSSSALSTATAVCALAIILKRSGVSDPESERLVQRGLDWLAAHVNADGGWGDTIRSLSNLSTTTLVWATFAVVPGADAAYPEVVTGAQRWLEQAAGSVEPKILAPEIAARYGKDRTFSVPILTVCALSGRWGTTASAWRWVAQLPFELAALPQAWFGALRLPVVSYALPALIAIGQVKHHFQPTRNPFARLLRNLARAATLRKLTQIQPGNGGFLEATPLTSFVTMNLAAMGFTQHPVTLKGVGFLKRSARADGSWPIDTNLATWLTTLAVNALAPRALTAEPQNACGAIRSWLLAQQYRREHPYTRAAPGGWAWTDLPGGVPDADDTAGALLALRRLGALDEATTAAGAAGVKWLLDLQNSDGGIPTFCRGWGTLPFDRSGADLTAHALRAWTEWLPELPKKLQAPVRRAISRGVRYLAKSQRTDGAWVPLWFGHERAPNDENPLYGTSRVLLALQQLRPPARTRKPEVEAGGGVRRALEIPEADGDPDISRMISLGLAWLTSSQNNDGGWSGGGSSSVEETALALEALSAHRAADRSCPGVSAEAVAKAISGGVEWLLVKLDSAAATQPTPIGFYFARLWYFERLYPLIFAAGALNKLAD